jgi:hypothetical protein
VSRRVVFLLVSLGAAGGCLFPSFSDLTSGQTVASTDGSDSLDAFAADAPDASEDAMRFSDATNLLLNPGFEGSGTGCGINWLPNNAFISQSTVAHSGQFSCQVCQVSAGSYYVHPATAVAVEGGAQYYFEAWIQAAPVDAAIAQQVKISIRPMDEAGVVEEGGLATSPAIVAPPSWRQISAVHVLLPGSIDSQVFFVSNDDAGSPACFLVDDVAMIQQ